MLTRENVATARLRFTKINGRSPQFLFLSLDAHTQLLLSLREYADFEGVTSLQGHRYMDMEIHIVPTINRFEYRVA